MPTALIADDEPLLRESLKRLLAQTWPALEPPLHTRHSAAVRHGMPATRPPLHVLHTTSAGLLQVCVAAAQVSTPLQ